MISTCAIQQQQQNVLGKHFKVIRTDYNTDITLYNIYHLKNKILAVQSERFQLWFKRNIIPLHYKLSFLLLCHINAVLLTG